MSVPSMDDARHRWRPLPEVIPRLPPAWMRWIDDHGSLTERLVRKSRGDFRVEVVEEGWRRVFAASLVSVIGDDALGRVMWSRKVVLWGCGEPWVSAHTLIPCRSLRTPLKQLKSLNAKPLGAFLFAHPELVRSGLDVARLRQGWGRRSLFHLYRKPILVAEYFLPSLLSRD